MGWEEGNNLLFIHFFLLLCGKGFLEEGEGNKAIFPFSNYYICNGICSIKDIQCFYDRAVK